MEQDKNNTENTRQFKGRFGLPTVLVIGALLGILGFGLGSNADKIDLSRYETTNPELPEDLSYESTEKVYDSLREKYAGELSEEELVNGLKKGLVNAAGDPFTEYLNAESAQKLQESLDGEFGGIGAEIGKRDGQLVVIAPLDGTPADKSGLRAQDAIVAVDGEDASDLTIQEAVTKIRGEEGTDVVLTVVRNGQAPQQITITRGHIEVPSVEAEMKEDNIGHIELIQFGNDSGSEFRRAASRLRDQGAEKIILDVRSNPGGYLDIAVNITSEFLESGEVVVEERRNGTVLNTQRAKSGGNLVGLPTVVLINEGSASASEIIAGALRDNDVAQLVGQQTFGKGSVQELVEFDNGSVLRVTIANWYTPGGSNIGEEGIEPDVEVELTEEDINNERDPQLQKAIQLLSQN